MKISVLRKLGLVIVALLCSNFAFAQADSIPIFTKFKLETRFDFDNSHVFTTHRTSGDYYKSNDYGFTGRYFNLIMGGNINEHFSYFFRQRIIPKDGMPNLFDNTDFLYLTWKINKNFSLTAGKQALHIGSFEYDAPPIDVYFPTEFWNQVACFQLGIAATYTDDEGKNSVVVQMTNSPNLYDGTIAERIFGRGLFAYNVAWYGNFNHFKTIYSVNMIERERGKFVNYIALGNKLEFDQWSLYLDYLNRAASFKKFFADFTLVGRLDVKLGKSFVIFAKGGYDQNNAEPLGVEEPKDIMIKPGYSYTFAGMGLEFRPAVYRDLRVHACVLYRNYGAITPEEFDDLSSATWSANVGLTWDLNFLKFIKKNRIKIKKENK